MSERVQYLLHMGLPAAVLQALTPRSPSLAPPEPPRKPLNLVPEGDRFAGAAKATGPADDVAAQLRGLAELHQAQQAARKAA